MLIKRVLLFACLAVFNIGYVVSNLIYQSVANFSKGTVPTTVPTTRQMQLHQIKNSSISNATRLFTEENSAPTMESIERKVFRIIRDQFGVFVNKSMIEENFKDIYGADSLDTVELVMALEDEFDIEIPEDDSRHMQTVQDAIDYLYKKLHD